MQTWWTDTSQYVFLHGDGQELQPQATNPSAVFRVGSASDVEGTNVANYDVSVRFVGLDELDDVGSPHEFEPAVTLFSIMP